jgi:hypothetical protein
MSSFPIAFFLLDQNGSVGSDELQPAADAASNAPVISDQCSSWRAVRPPGNLPQPKEDFATALALVMAGGMALSGALYAELSDRAYAAMTLAAALGGVFVLLARGWVTQSTR